MASENEQKLSQAALYFYDIYPDYFKDNIALARECAKYITKRGLSLDEIIKNKGLEFPLQDHYVDIFMSKRKSIYGENEKEVRTPYSKDKKRKIIIDIIKKVTIAVCATAAVVLISKGIGKAITNDPLAREKTEAFSTLDNRVVTNYDKGSYYIDDESASSEFLEEVLKHPEQFDIGLHGIYSSINQNRLSNMDHLFRTIKLKLESNIRNNHDLEVSSMLYEKVKDCDYFLDYVYTLPLEHTDGIELALIEYGAVRDFNELPTEYQNIIQKEMDGYRASGKLLEKSTTDVELPRIKGEV